MTSLPPSFYPPESDGVEPRARALGPAGSSRSSDAAERVYLEFATKQDSLGTPVEFEALCAAHPGLADELRRLRQLDGAAQDFLRQAGNVAPVAATHPQQSGLSGDPVLSVDSTPSGELLQRLKAAAAATSRYKQLGEIGRGGMGAVLRVWDGDLRRILAMKVMLGGAARASEGGAASLDSRMLGRFLEEAQITGQLDHPGIVPVHELGLGSDGQVYFTMRLVKGEDLRTIFQHVESGHDGWNMARALGVMLKVCEAMAYAHSKGVIHRDLKPANIMVGRYGEVYVMDWGLARVAGAKDLHDVRPREAGPSSLSVRTERREERDESPDSPILTMDGDVLGTPAYMSPEQARGDLAQLGPHSDVYAVGAMLYHLLLSRHIEMPYVPKGAKLSQHRVLMLAQSEAPKGIASLDPNVPGPLVAIVEKAMARDIPGRYRNMEELANDLRAFLEGRIESRSASLFELTHLQPSLVFLYVGAFVAVLGAWVASTVAWSAFSHAGRAAFLVGAVALLGGVARAFWLRGDQRNSLAASLGIMLAFPALAFALLHLVPALQEVRVGEEARELRWDVFDPDRGQIESKPDDVWSQVRASSQQRIDLKLLMVAAAALAAARWLHRATQAALHWWMCVLYGWLTWWLLTINLGWRTLEDHHRLEYLWIPALGCMGVGFLLERKGRSDRSRPLLVLGFLVLAGTWVAYTRSGHPLEYVTSLERDELVQLSMVLGGALALLLGWLAQRQGTPLLQRYAAGPYLVSSAAVLLSLSALVAERMFLYEVLLPLACLGFVVLSLALQRKNLLYAGSFYLAVAVFQISQNHFEEEWAWPLALVATGVGLGASSFLLRRFDASRA